MSQGVTPFRIRRTAILATSGRLLFRGYVRSDDIILVVSLLGPHSREVLAVSVIPLNSQTAKPIIADSWQAVIKRVEAGHPVSSEKTLCFLMAMEVRDRCGANTNIDFENQCYAKLQGESKYLDLLLYTNPQIKIAIEVKMPKRSRSGNSDQTTTRAKVYRDLARLSYLQRSGFASACFFLMATDESPYLNNTGTGPNPGFITRQGHAIASGTDLIAEGLPLKDVACTFHWENVKHVNGKWSPAGRFAWLKPIEL